MRTVKDLRDLINVSRLTYRESDDENDENPRYLNENDDDFDYDTILTMNSTLNNNHSIIDKTRMPLLNNVSSSTNTASSLLYPVSKGNFNFMVPNMSKQSPLTSTSLINKSKSDQIQSRNSLLSSKDLLLDRNSIPKLSLSNFKKPLPPLQSKNSKNEKNLDDFKESNSNGNHESLIEENPKRPQIQNSDTRKLKMSIEPLGMSDEENNDEKPVKKTLTKTVDANAGNFDYILLYVDASVVSEWLNRANRSLKKMFKWHRDNKDSYFNDETNPKKLLKYESFIRFCNFWLGGGTSFGSSASKELNGNKQKVMFSEKQRRNLIEMEYSIICDEVVQAFQIGIESQKISLKDINMLIKAVFREYPIQLLSFRGAYLLLNYIDVLSSDRHDEEYKKLLSDVKCRTVNKQYAQWLLSIRSFALINLCWSVIKFFRKTVKIKKEYEAVTARILTARSRLDRELDMKEDENEAPPNSVLAELDGRLSSLTILNHESEMTSMTSSSSSSISSHSSTESSSATSSKSSLCLNLRRKSAKTKADSEAENYLLMTPSHVKYDLYLEAVYKNDYPDVLHYLITTQKCNVLKKDEHGRTLIFLAVMNEKPKILRYLVKRWPSIDINAENDSGNTPLHAAVNKGKLELVEIILESLANTNMKKSDTNIPLDVNKINTKCMNATALHLAVWNDFTDIALRLIQANADPYLKMNGTSDAFELARENSNETLYDLLNEFFHSKKEDVQ